MPLSLNEDFEFEKNKYILSIWKNISSKSPCQSPSKPDVAVIVCLLKAIGFHLEKFERHDTGDTEDVEQNKIKISIQCGSSKMQAILKMDDISCRCPDPDEQNGSFWSVTGSDNVNKIEETGSTLLPHVSKQKNLILQYICHSLFEIIEEKNNSEADISTSSICSGMLYSGSSKNEPLGLTRSSTQPEIIVKGRASLPPNYKPSDVFSCSNLKPISPTNSSTISTSSRNSSDSSRQKLPVKQDTYDLDIDIDGIEEKPRTFPPNKTKSPEIMVSNLCGSLDKISFGNSDDNVLEYILSTLKNLEKVVENHIKKPVSSSQISLHDEVFRKPSAVFGDSFISNASKSTVSRAGSTTSLNSLSRTSTTLQRSNMRKSIGVTSRAGLSNEKNTTTTTKTPTPARKSLITPSRVNSVKTSAEKTKKYTTASERTFLTPKRRMSEVGTAGNQIRTTSSTIKPPTTKSQITKTQTSSITSRFGFKK